MTLLKNEAGNDINLDADDKVILLSTKDSEFTQEKKSNNSLFWQSSSDTGSETETVNHVEITKGGNLNINSKAVIVDVKNMGTVSQSIDELAKTPELAYLKELKSDPNINWNKVDAAYKNWDYHQQGLTPAAAAVIAIAATAATMGAAGPAALAAAAGAAATTAGASAAAATAISTATMAGMASLASTASVSMINNKGDIGAVLKELGSSEYAKQLAIAVVTAGATQYAGTALGYGNAASPAGTAANPSGAITSSNLTIGQHAQKVVVDSAIQSTAQSAIYGDNLGATFVDRLISNTAFAAGSEGANKIGDLKADGTLNDVTHKVAHAGLGCAIGSISGDCASGAIGGAVSEIGAELSGSADIGQYTALGVALLSGADAKGISTANNTALNSLQNNYLDPHEKSNVIKLLKDKENCQGSQCDEIDVRLNELQKISDMRDAEFKGYLSACGNGNQFACTHVKEIHYDLRKIWTLEGNDYYLTHKDEFKPMLEREKIYHTFPRDPLTGNVLEGEVNNTKWIHPTLGYEVVLDPNKNIVTDPLNMGTYNFYNPGLFGNSLINSAINHMKYDVDPYNMFGNTLEDPTTTKQRNNRKEKYIPALGKDISNAIRNKFRNRIQNGFFN